MIKTDLLNSRIPFWYSAMFSNWCNVLCSRIFSCTVIALTGSYKVQTKWTKLAVSHISFFSSCRHHQARSSESGWGKKRVSLVSSKTPTKCHLTLSSFHLTLIKTTIVTLKKQRTWGFGHLSMFSTTVGRQWHVVSGKNIPTLTILQCLALMWLKGKLSRVCFIATGD